MKNFEFITIDDMSKPPKERKAIVWCKGNTPDLFFEFMQFVLDSTNNPKAYMIIDTDTHKVYDMYRVATEQYHMHKRTFEERMQNVTTWKEPTKGDKTS